VFPIPANIADKKIRQRIIFKKKDILLPFKRCNAFSPLFNINLNKKNNMKKESIIQGKENQPKREKNTTISFPLTKPEPITVPIMAKNAEKLFFIRIFYYSK